MFLHSKMPVKEYLDLQRDKELQNIDYPRENYFVEIHIHKNLHEMESFLL